MVFSVCLHLVFSAVQIATLCQHERNGYKLIRVRYWVNVSAQFGIEDKARKGLSSVPEDMHRAQNVGLL